MLSDYEDINDSQKFTLIDFVLYFSRYHFLKIKDYLMPLALTCFGYFNTKIWKILIFDSFLDLTNFLLFDFSCLDNCEAFNFSDFLAYSTLSSLISYPLSLLLLLLFLLNGLYLIFLLKARLLLLFRLGAYLLGNLVVFSINVIKVFILQKPWINF